MLTFPNMASLNEKIKRFSKANLGASVGSVLGPVGTVVGAAAGALSGGTAKKSYSSPQVSVEPGPSSTLSGPSSKEIMSQATPSKYSGIASASSPSAINKSSQTSPVKPSSTAPSSIAPTDPYAGLTGAARQQAIEGAQGITSKIAPPASIPTFSAAGTSTPTTPKVDTSGIASPTPADTRVADATTARDAARAKYLAAFQSPELAKLQEDLNQYNTDTSMMVNAEEGTGRDRVAGLVRGRQEKLLDQRGIDQLNLTERIKIEEGRITRDQNMALQELGFAQQDLEAINAEIAAEGANFGEIKEFGDQLLRIAPDGSVSVIAEKSNPTVLSEGQVLVDPNTGEQIAINMKDQEPITLSAGQVVVDPNTGQVLFQAANKPEALPTSIQEYLLAVDQGYTGSFIDYEKVAGSGAGNLTASAQSEIVLINSANQLIDEIVGLASPSGNIPGVGTIQGMVPDFLTGESAQDVRAKLGLLRAAVVKANAGTSFTDGERALLEEYLPKPTDTDGMIKTKLENLKSFLNSKASFIQSAAGGGGTAPSAGGGDALDQALGTLGL